MIKRMKELAGLKERIEFEEDEEDYSEPVETTINDDVISAKDIVGLKKKRPDILVLGYGKEQITGLHYLKISLLTESGNEYIEKFFGYKPDMEMFRKQLDFLRNKPFLAKMKVYNKIKKYVKSKRFPFESEKLK
jgi:hypothetical protein